MNGKGYMFESGADKRTRTSTGLRPLEPESSTILFYLCCFIFVL